MYRAHTHTTGTPFYQYAVVLLSTEHYKADFPCFFFALTLFIYDTTSDKANAYLVKSTWLVQKASHATFAINTKKWLPS